MLNSEQNRAFELGPDLRPYRIENLLSLNVSMVCAFSASTPAKQQSSKTTNLNIADFIY